MQRNIEPTADFKTAVSFEALSELFSKADINLSQFEYNKFCDYANYLVEYNQVVNLTAITQPLEIAQKHFLDSVLPFYLKPIDKNAKVADIGTGAGFPSCPLKIMREDIEITLVDSLNKRVKFLQNLSDKLGLNAECIHARGEVLGLDEKYCGKYDVVCARAVKNLTELVTYCLPFVKVGGYFYSLKGKIEQQEIEDAQENIKNFGGVIEQTIEYSLPDGDGRTLIIIKKISDKIIKPKKSKKKNKV